jgi:hypothetical protein
LRTWVDDALKFLLGSAAQGAVVPFPVAASLKLEQASSPQPSAGAARAIPLAAAKAAERPNSDPSQRQSAVFEIRQSAAQ